MTDVAPHASDSTEQRSAEVAIISAVAAHVGCTLATETIVIDGARVQIDGVSPDRSVLVEAYAHIGEPKGAQPKKLTTDAFKLAWAGGKLGASRLIIAVADVETERYLLRPRAWLTAALRDAGVEVIRVDLDEAMRASVVMAQDRQYR